MHSFANITHAEMIHSNLRTYAEHFFNNTCPFNSEVLKIQSSLYFKKVIFILLVPYLLKN